MFEKQFATVKNTRNNNGGTALAATPKNNNLPFEIEYVYKNDGTKQEVCQHYLLGTCRLKERCYRAHPDGKEGSRAAPVGGGRGKGKGKGKGKDERRPKSTPPAVGRQDGGIAKGPVCFNCERPGHTKAECWRPPNGGKYNPDDPRFKATNPQGGKKGKDKGKGKGKGAGDSGKNGKQSPPQKKGGNAKDGKQSPAAAPATSTKQDTRNKNGKRPFDANGLWIQPRQQLKRCKHYEADDCPRRHTSCPYLHKNQDPKDRTGDNSELWATLAAALPVRGGFGQGTSAQAKKRAEKRAAAKEEATAKGKREKKTKPKKESAASKEGAQPPPPAKNQ